MNKVMKPGAYGHICTHQTFPLHEVPYDFWRYSADTWRALFNKYSGFEILGAEMTQPVRVTSPVETEMSRGFQDAEAFALSEVLFRKTSDTFLRWNVDPAELLDSAYPHTSIGDAKIQLVDVRDRQLVNRLFAKLWRR
jgi:hypothetical protein